MIHCFSSRRWPALLAALLAVTAARSAIADFCFPTPVPVPGLSNAPEWDPGGTPPIRTDLLDPRWGAAPATEFESDAGGHAVYRVLLNNERTELSVSVQALVNPPGAETVYLGISTDGSGGIAKAIALEPPNSSPAGQPATGSVLAAWTRAGGTWSGILSIPADFGIHDISGWVNAPGGGVEWALNFKVHLSEVGVVPGTDFRMFLGMQTSPSTPQSTPDSSLDAHIAGTIIPEDPANWALADAVDTVCTGGITLERINIGTTNANPSHINSSNGEVNTFFAQPNYPLGVPPANTIRGRFRWANWGSVADPGAAWPVIEGGDAVGNLAGSGRLQFNCPTNTATTVCNTATPATSHQCMMVELFPSPGQDANITTAAVYRNMDFVPLSKMARKAELNIAGLTKKLEKIEPAAVRKHRDIYLYLKTNNMPEHGDEPLWLPAHAMEKARRAAFAPRTPLYRPVASKPVTQAPDVAREQPAMAKRPNVAVPKAAPVVDAAGPQAAKPQRPGLDPDLVRPLVAPEVLELNTYQTLAATWPSYEVYPFYDTGRVRKIDGKVHMQLKSMPSWTYYFEHDGPFYGFEYRLEAAGGKLVEIAPNFYKVVVPNEGSVTLVDNVVAHETPKRGKPPGECKPLGAEHGKVHQQRCTCRIVGDPRSPVTYGSLGAVLLMGLLLVWRRRRDE